MADTDSYGEAYYTPPSDGTAIGNAKRLLPSKRLFDPFGGDVWGLYYDNSDPGSPLPAVLAERHYPFAARIDMPGEAAFWVMPSVLIPADNPDDKASKGEEQVLNSLGVKSEDIPLALFSGLVSEILGGHKTYDRVVQQAIDKITKAYKQVMSYDFGGLIDDAANAKKDRDKACPDCQGWGMAIEAREHRLWPSADLYDVAIERMREAHNKGTSFAAALADIRDRIATSPEAKHRFDLLSTEHAANELLAKSALEKDSEALKSFALKNGISVADARSTLLSRAGAAVPRVSLHGKRPMHARVLPHRTRSVSNPVSSRSLVTYFLGGGLLLSVSYYLWRRT